MPITLKDIAQACGVNISTVSRSLNGSYGVDTETRNRVLAVAESMNYRRNRMARSLATGQSHTLGLVVSDIRNPFFTELARGVEDATNAAGYDLVLCNSDYDSAKQMHYFHTLAEKRVDGIIINTASALNQEHQDIWISTGVPVVLLNRARGTHNFSSIAADNVKGGLIAGDYLIKLGHRKIAHLTGPREHKNLADRAKGFTKALHSIDSTITPITLRGLPSYRGGYEMTRQLLSETPDVTAIFAASDAIAFGAIQAISEAGLSVPEDISLIGFDNVELAGIVRPPLTTIDQPKYEKGRAAVEMLLDIIAHREVYAPEHRVLEVKLVERQSCRAL